jgi:hypothetical protein
MLRQLRLSPKLSLFDGRSPWSQKQDLCRRISGQNVRKSRRKGIATTNRTRRKPASPAGLAPPVLPLQTKNEQHRLVAHLAKLGRYRVDVERVAVQPIRRGLCGYMKYFTFASRHPGYEFNGVPPCGLSLLHVRSSCFPCSPKAPAGPSSSTPCFQYVGG